MSQDNNTACPIPELYFARMAEHRRNNIECGVTNDKKIRPTFCRKGTTRLARGEVLQRFVDHVSRPCNDGGSKQGFQNCFLCVDSRHHPVFRHVGCLSRGLGCGWRASAGRRGHGRGAFGSLLSMMMQIPSPEQRERVGSPVLSSRRK